MKLVAAMRTNETTHLTPHHPATSNMQSGFTMLEMAIVLAVVALIASMSVYVGSRQIERQEIIKTYDELKVIRKSLRQHATFHNRLPCPMRLDLIQTDTTYGLEHPTCAPADVVPSGMIRIEYPASSGSFIRIGAVPFRALALSNDFAADEWNNRYIYAVNEEFIDDIDVAEIGTISIIDDAANQITADAAFVLYSHGASGEGGTDDERVAVDDACDATDRDGENCNNDGVYVDAPYNNGSVVGNFSDDIILWLTKTRLFLP